MKNSVVKGAAIIAAGGLISKIIGAVYRVPLTNIIGAEGIGLYQTVFPVYCALLTLSSTGIPTALSKLVADGGEDGIVYFKRAVLIFGGVGLLGSLLMFAFGGIIATLQGNPSAAPCYRALSPSIVLVSVISCIRGYFQGKGKMSPTAISQITEQIVKTAFGLILCKAFEGNVVLGATFATLAVTVSEGIAVIYLGFKLRREKIVSPIKHTLNGVNGKILALALPAMLSAVAIPLGHLADSFIVVNVMKTYAQNATALFGVYSGSVAAIVGVPVAVAYGVAVALVPNLKGEEARESSVQAIRLTAFVSIPSAVFILCFSTQIIDFLYGGMVIAERQAAVKILCLESFSVVFLSFLQTANAMLLACGKQKTSAKIMACALAARVVLCLVFVSIPSVGILGAVIASDLSCLVAALTAIRVALPRRLLPRALSDVTKCIICAIICVLGGLCVNFALKGRGAIVACTAVSVVTYFVISALVFKEGELPFKNFIKLKRKA